MNKNKVTKQVASALKKEMCEYCGEMRRVTFHKFNRKFKSTNDPAKGRELCGDCYQEKQHIFE